MKINYEDNFKMPQDYKSSGAGVFTVKFNGQPKSIKSIIETIPNLKDKLLGQGIYSGNTIFLNIIW